jgi:VIT1/CCC1 family predicted Fe2+/Mn2+ transporter
LLPFVVAEEADTALIAAVLVVVVFLRVMAS